MAKYYHFLILSRNNFLASCSSIIPLKASFGTKKKRSAVKRGNTTTKKTLKGKTKAKINPTVATSDTLVAVAAPATDTLPVKKILKSLIKIKY